MKPRINTTGDSPAACMLPWLGQSDSAAKRKLVAAVFVTCAGSVSTAMCGCKYMASASTHVWMVKAVACMWRDLGWQPAMEVEQLTHGMLHVTQVNVESAHMGVRL